MEQKRAEMADRTILHVDMDAFYAAIEQRDRPELRSKPVIVGADPQRGKGRGIVSTCSYEARRFGVHSAQPISQAWRLCPDGVYLRPNMAEYMQTSERIMLVLHEFTDLVESASVDEAFLDVTGCRRLLGTGEQIGRAIKRRIQQDQQLTASVGVAQNKFLAKIASDLEKPDGLVVVPNGQEREFLRPLPIARLWGVGAKTEKLLAEAGVHSIGQLASMSLEDLSGIVGRRAGEHLRNLSQGIDHRSVQPGGGCKSVGHETTFSVDTQDPALLHATLLQLTENVAHRLRTKGLRGRTIRLKFRESDFTTHTRSVTVPRPVDTFESIFPVVSGLLESLLGLTRKVRLIGVSMTNLEAAAPGGQLPLFNSARRNQEMLAAAMDDITRRFGAGAVKRATLAVGRETGNGNVFDEASGIRRNAGPRIR